MDEARGGRIEHGEGLAPRLHGPEGAHGLMNGFRCRTRAGAGSRVRFAYPGYDLDRSPGSPDKAEGRIRGHTHPRSHRWTRRVAVGSSMARGLAPRLHGPEGAHGLMNGFRCRTRAGARPRVRFAYPGYGSGGTALPRGPDKAGGSIRGATRANGRNGGRDSWPFDRASAPGALRLPGLRGRRRQAATGNGADWARPPASTISATRPSPRMVAPETPATRR